MLLPPCVQLLTEWRRIRICPGRHFGETNVWYMIANITATLDISKSLDDDGVEVTPAFEVISSFVRWAV